VPIAFGTCEEHYPYYPPYEPYYKWWYHSLGDVPSPSEMGVFFEVQPRTDWVVAMTVCPVEYPTWVDQFCQRHNGGGNIGFMDGHAKWVSHSVATDPSNAVTLYGHR